MRRSSLVSIVTRLLSTIVHGHVGLTYALVIARYRSCPADTCHSQYRKRKYAGICREIDVDNSRAYNDSSEALACLVHCYKLHSPVSQIWALMVFLSTWIVWVANSTPIVDLESLLNSSRVNRVRRLDFPTPESPINTTAQHQIRIIVGLASGQPAVIQSSPGEVDTPAMPREWRILAHAEKWHVLQHGNSPLNR